jgi:hypothetical protein
VTIRYAVTFEFNERAPVTHRGTVTAGRIDVCAKRAIDAARRALKPVHWDSMVFVALERLDAAVPDTDALPVRQSGRLPARLRQPHARSEPEPAR